MPLRKAEVLLKPRIQLPDNTAFLGITVAQVGAHVYDNFYKTAKYVITIYDTQQFL
jgi:hypothetical protein